MNFICDLILYIRISIILRYCNDDTVCLWLYKHYYEHRSQVILCDELLNISREKRVRFERLKNIFSNSEKKPQIELIFSPRDLSDILQLLLPEVTLEFCNLVMNICDLCYDEWQTWFPTLNNNQWNDAVNRNRVHLDDWLNVLHEYKDNVNFRLQYYFPITSNDDVRKMATKVSEPLSDSRFKSNVCFKDAQLSLRVYGGDAEFLLKALIGIAKNCNRLSIALFYKKYKGQDEALDSNLLSLYLASNVYIYQLSLNFDSFKEFQLQLLNASKLDILRLHAKDADNKMFSEFLKKINWKNQTNSIEAFIKPKQLQCLYKNIPQEIVRKTCVVIKNPLALEDVPLAEEKTFQRIYSKSPNDETYKALKKITIDIRGRFP